MDKQRLEEIKEELTVIPPLPWHHKEGILKHYIYSDNKDLGFSLQELHPDDGREWPTKETARFLALSHQRIKDLVTEVERLRAENERLKANFK